MYRITCDGNVLYDPRGAELGYSVHDPKVKLEVNTVGEGSFTIYNSHPNYDKLQMMKSVFEVSDEIGVLFRGRMTENTIDFDHGMTVDMEGAMAYFNDTIVQPFTFPEDFLNNANYIAAKNSGNVVAFLLGWLIDQHNAQVKDWQKFKLGNVTVSDPNNYVYRYNKDWLSTWETLKTRFFESELGGYLCIRYESDGNYIDYLSEFTETNNQEIMFGENLLNLSNKFSSSGVFSAIIPIGAEVEKTVTSTETSGDFEFGTSFETSTTIKYTVTLDSVADGTIDGYDDIVKRGRFLYSKSAVERYGWICADPKESTFEDVKTTSELLRKAVKMLTGDGVLLSQTIEVSAFDLHLTNDQIQSLRIYKNINVRSDPHGLSATYPLSKLDLDLLKPQSTKITVGKTEKTLTEQTASKVNNAVQRVESTANNLFQEVASSQGNIADLQENTIPKNEVISSINQSAEEIKIQAQRLNLVGAVTADTIAAGAVTADKIASDAITSDKINVDDLFAQDIKMNGKFITTADVFFEPSHAEVETLTDLLERGDATAEEIALWDFNGDGRVDYLDKELAQKAIVGEWSISQSAIAKKSTATVTIDISNPTKAIRINGVNMWGRTVETYFGVNSPLMSANYMETLQALIERSNVVMRIDQGGTGATTPKEARNWLGISNELEEDNFTGNAVCCHIGYAWDADQEHTAQSGGSILLSVTASSWSSASSASFLVSFDSTNAQITKINETNTDESSFLESVDVVRYQDSFDAPTDIDAVYFYAGAIVVNIAQPSIAKNITMRALPLYPNAANDIETLSYDITEGNTIVSTLPLNNSTTIQSTKPIPISSGGTGATTAAQARSALGITAANIKAAPDGYGLGTIAPSADWNSATVTGFYKGATNSPNGQWWEGFVVAYNETHCVQSAWRASENLHCERVMANGAFGEWEWVNPPMNLGTEYRTTERWQGKAVYTKLVDFGALPNSTLKQIQHGAAATNIVRYAATRSDGEAIPFWYSTSHILIDVSKSSIVLTTTFDGSAKTATVQIWYTKD